MSAGLLLVSFAAVAAALYALRPKEDPLGRAAFLQSAVYHGVLISVLTEVLSAAKALDFPHLVWVWSGLAIGHSCLMALLWRGRPRAFGRHKMARRLRTWGQKHSTSDRLVIAAVLLIAAICLVTALLSVPNNYDSMTYHMPRVMHWIQNRSVAHYPTSDLRQIVRSPGAGYLLAHLQILSGGDRFANCVQWFAFLGSVLGISLLAKRLGLAKAQALAALAAASLPMAIMQSTTTQNDLLVAFWLSGFAALALKPGESSFVDRLWLAGALGLAILTKPTGAVLGGPLLLLTLPRLRRGPGSPGVGIPEISRWAAHALLIAAVAGSLSIPHLWRNFSAFGSILGEIPNLTELNRDPILRTTILSPFMSLALNLPLPVLWRVLFKAYGISPAQVDPGGFSRRLILPDEDIVGSPFHLLLAAAALSWLFSFSRLRSRPKRWDLRRLVIAVCAGFAALSLLTVWDPHHNRRLLPCAVLLAPVVAAFLIEQSARIRLGAAAVLSILGLAYSLTPIHRPLIALPETMTSFSQSRSILGLKRREAYLSGYGKHAKDVFFQIAEQAARVDRCRSIGLVLECSKNPGRWNPPCNEWEYIWWTLISSPETRTRFKHLQVRNLSARLPQEFPNEELCALIHSARNGAALHYYRVVGVRGEKLLLK